MFDSCSGLKSITIPASVIRIESDAFKNAGLTAVTIPASVQDIGNAFANCETLQMASLPYGLKDYTDRFSSMTKVTVRNPSTPEEKAYAAQEKAVQKAEENRLKEEEKRRKEEVRLAEERARSTSSSAAAGNSSGASRASTGSDMVSKGVSYIISKMRSPSHATVRSYVDAAELRKTFRESYNYEYPAYLDAILYEVEAMNGFGGYGTESYVVFFKNGNPVTWLPANQVTPADWKRLALPTLQYSGWK